MASGRSASHAPTARLRAEQEAAARWVEAFAAPGYGPHGGAKVVDGPDPRWLLSPAVALAEVQPTPALAPYQDLAARLRTQAGDAATTGLLLAARLVRLALDSPAGPAAFVQGYPLARRQALALLSGLAQPATAEQALAATAPDPAWAAAVLAGLPRTGTLDLDAIEITAEPVAAPTWLAGIPLAAQRPPRREGPTRLVALTAAWRIPPRTGATWRSPTGAAQAEQALRREALTHLQALRATTLACTSSIDEGLAGLLQDHGIVVATDVALSRLRRLADATGAHPVARLRDATAADVGRGRFTRSPTSRRGWLLAGAAGSRTLAMPAHNAVMRAAAIEAGERLLRAAGPVLAEARVLPGAGVWQRQVAAGLRRAADAGPGRTPFALHAAAAACAALDADLRTNAGGVLAAPGASAGPAADSPAVRDPYACVRLAVGSAFDLALALVRVDARHTRRASTPAGLRGGLGKAGSPKGLPGDLPPLM